MKQTTRAALALVTALLGAIALTGLRYYQLFHCMDENGLLIRGSRVAWGFVGLVVIVVAALVILLVGLKRTAGTEKAFSCGIFPRLCSAAAAGLFLVACAVCSIRTPLDDLPHVIIFSVGVLCGALLIISDALRMMGRRSNFLLLLIPSVFFAAKLVIDFKNWSVDPNVIDFCFKLLASITVMLACFNLSGFPLDVGKKRATVFFCLLAFVFCSMTAADWLLHKNCPTREMLLYISLGLWCLINGLILLFGKDDVPQTAEALPEQSSVLPDEIVGDDTELPF